MDLSSVRLEKWDDIPVETVKDGLTRQLFTGERMMVAQLSIARGAIVPWHSHENEQLSWVVSGAVRFLLGEEGSENVMDVVVSAGEILFIPSNVPHWVEALEDTAGVDIFSPPRQDWLDGSDSYFRDED